MRHSIPLILAALLLPLPAGAATLSSLTSFGKDTFIEDVSADGEFGAEEQWSWDADFTDTRSVDSTQTTVDNQSVVDETKSYRAGMGWKQEAWAALLDLETAKTAQENLTSSGAEFAVSYKDRYSADAASGFKKYWSLKADFGGDTYTQQFSGVTKRLKKPRAVSGQNVIHQTSAKLDFRWRPQRPWLFKLSFTTYGYDKNVAKFQDSLDSPAAASRGMSGFSSTLGGLPASTTSAGVLWYFAEDWDFNLSHSRSVLAADHSLSTMTRLQLEADVTDNWQFSLGGEDDVSSTLKEFLVLAGLEYTF